METSRYSQENLKQIAEWKTKIFLGTDNPEQLVMRSKWNITAWNWKRNEFSEEKAKLSTTITSNIFEFLRRRWILSHYITKLNDTDILVDRCDMLPIEVICRRISTWSHFKRNHEKFSNWEILDWIVFELNYKHTVYEYNESFPWWSRPIDDPLLKIVDGVIQRNANWLPVMMNPDNWEELTYNWLFVNPNSWEEIPVEQVMEEMDLLQDEFDYIKDQAIQTFEELSKAFLKRWLIMFDFKVEFWKRSNWKIILADVIDWDSCRIRIPRKIQVWDEILNVWDDRNMEDFMSELDDDEKVIFLEWDWLDKQWYREWESVDSTVRKYGVLAEITTAICREWIKDALTKCLNWE